MVSILNGNYAGKVGLFACYRKASALVNLNNRIGEVCRILQSIYIVNYDTHINGAYGEKPSILHNVQHRMGNYVHHLVSGYIHLFIRSGHILWILKKDV